MEIAIKFYGIDNFNRPVFKHTNKKYFFGLIDYLFSDDEDFNNQKDHFIKWLEEHQEHITFFGTQFNCEPLGTQNKSWKFKIIA